MAYLDKEQKFYDYGTKYFDGKNPFDTSKTGISFYNQFLTDPDYMQQYKNLKSTIVKMSPKEYFQACANIFNSTSDNQINQTKADKETIQHLKEVLLKYRKTFPLTFLNYAESSQEGRHRMYVAGEMFGWNEKFPVMVIEYADEELQQQQELDKLNSEKEAIFQDIELVVESIQNNSFEYENIFEVIEDLKWNLRFKYNKNDTKIFYDGKNSIVVEIKNVSYKIPVWSFDLKKYPESDEDILSEEDEAQIISELEKMGLKSW